MGLVLWLNKDEWFVAIIFGVMIDLDHIFAAPGYISANGWDAIMRATWDDGSGRVWRSLFHEPVGFFVVAPLAVGWRFMVPLLFWGTHLGVDWLQTATIEYSAVVESAFLVLVVAGIVHVLYRRWKALNPGSNFPAYLAFASSSIRSYFSSREGPTQGHGGST